MMLSCYSLKFLGFCEILLWVISLMSYDELERLVLFEVKQRGEEGCDVSEVRSALAKIKKKDVSQLMDIMERLSTLNPTPDFPYSEPSILDEIRKERPGGPRRLSVRMSDSEILDKIYGGWLGRCAGCLLGKPAEGLRREHIERWLKAADAYPLSDYFPPLRELPEDAESWLKNRISQTELLRGNIDRMVRDDDIDYTILNLHVLETYGFEFTTEDIGRAWLSNLPFLRVYTAERVAYKNLADGLSPPKTATHMNPYREWIGARIRADTWGYVTPGMPEYGAELAFRDARLSHVKNGIYGEMFISAMISAAFTTNDIDEIISIGLSEIPANSRLSEAVRDVVAWRKKYSDWKETWAKINDKYGAYHPIHVINNTALVILGLLYGEGDFEKSITISVMGGWDTDCNGATVGSIVGVMLGAARLPEKWIAPLNDRVESIISEYNNSRLSDLARRTFSHAKKTLANT